MAITFLIAFSLVLALVIFPSTMLFAQDLLPDIDSIVISQRDAAEIPGMAVAVIEYNKVIYKKALGWQDLESKAALDSPLIRYLPSFKMKDPAYVHITLRHVLIHRSGIPDTPIEYREIKHSNFWLDLYFKSKVLEPIGIPAVTRINFVYSLNSAIFCYVNLD